MRWLFCAMVVMSWAVGAVLPAAEPKAVSEKDLPVILLTGFEPFGPGRPPNPSWEGVKRLGDSIWNGHRIVARQMPVVWGAPAEKLAEWTQELKPVAIFSFGQGGGYALETVADNRRAKYPDNRGAVPQQAEIERGGPKQYTASIDATALAKRLAAKGYPVQVSQEAGNYLCEECLYALEHWKATEKHDKIDVLFCHLPPLSAKYRSADVEAFMRVLLESWYAQKQASK
jgi:pyroglutamyl-peptidase